LRKVEGEQQCSVDDTTKSKERLKDLLLTADIDLIFGLKNVQKQHLPLDQCILLMQAHCLPSFVILLQVLIKNFGFKSENIVLVPKPYSTISSSFAELAKLNIHLISNPVSYRPGLYDNSQTPVLKRACDSVVDIFHNNRKLGRRRPRIIVVDDGGLLTKMWDGYRKKYDIPTVSVQHTASGIGPQRGAQGIPKVDVARSAAKRIFEAPIISTSVGRKVRSMGLDFKGRTVGIVGLGAIGENLAKSLEMSRDSLIGLELPTFNKHSHVKNVYYSAAEFLNKCDVIFGCSGKNWSAGLKKPRISGKRFISCSSRDVEFKHLLENYAADEERSNFAQIILNEDNETTVCNSGFPINFDRNREWETFDEMGLTRLLILYGILISSFIDTNDRYNDTLMLPAVLQKRMVGDWLQFTNKDLTQFKLSHDDFSNLDFWLSESGGRNFFE
tara:strand:- start:207746 stop:209074 length:1329 start_codon:yes stop_codon:yes gene_type:complete